MLFTDDWQEKATKLHPSVSCSCLSPSCKYLLHDDTSFRVERSIQPVSTGKHDRSLKQLRSMVEIIYSDM